MPRTRPSGERRTWWWGLALVAALVVTAKAGRAQEDLLGELKTVASVTFVGRHHVTARELGTVMKTRAPSLWPWHERPVLRPDFLRSDTLAIRDRYRLHGFLDAEVGATVAATHDSNAVAVTFLIREGHQSRVASVAFHGVEHYPVDDIRRKLQTRRGVPFDPYVLQLDTLKISELYQERGYRPSISAVARRGEGNDSLRVQVDFEVVEGTRYRVGRVSVEIQGDRPVAPWLARREVMLKPGDWYRRSFLVRSWERLYDTGLFSSVQMTPTVDSTRDSIDIDVTALPRKPRWIDAGVGSGTAERFRVTGEWGYRNLMGRGIQGALDSRIAFNGQGKFLLAHTEGSLLAPWMFGKRIRGVVTPYYENSHDRADPRWLVVQDLRGVRFELRRDIDRFSSIALSQDNVWGHQALTLFTDTLAAATRDSLQRSVVSSYSTHSLSLGAQWDYRDNPFSATRGSFHVANLELAGGPLKGTSSFRKFAVTSSWYTPFRNGWVLATRVEAGAIEPIGIAPAFSLEPSVDPTVARVPLPDRFRLGGVNSIRGFSENQVPPSGGLAMLLANVEMRIPLVGPFGLEVYADAGNVWARPQYIKGHDFPLRLNHTVLGPGDVRYVVGIGPRLNLPIGPLRFDLTWSLRPVPDPVTGQAVWLIRKAQFAIGPSF